METICVTYGKDWTDGLDGRTDSSDTICPSIENGGGIKMCISGCLKHSETILTRQNHHTADRYFSYFSQKGVFAV